MSSSGKDPGNDDLGSQAAAVSTNSYTANTSKKRPRSSSSTTSTITQTNNIASSSVEPTAASPKNSETLLSKDGTKDVKNTSTDPTHKDGDPAKKKIKHSDDGKNKTTSANSSKAQNDIRMEVDPPASATPVENGLEKEWTEYDTKFLIPSLDRLAEGLPQRELKLIIEEAKACEQALMEEIQQLQGYLNSSSTTATADARNSTISKAKKQRQSNQSTGTNDALMAVSTETTTPTSTFTGSREAVIQQMLVSDVTPPDRYFTVSALLGRLRGRELATPLPPNTTLPASYINRKGTTNAGGGGSFIFGSCHPLLNTATTSNSLKNSGKKKQPAAAAGASSATPGSGNTSNAQSVVTATSSTSQGNSSNSKKKKANSTSTVATSPSTNTSDASTKQKGGSSSIGPSGKNVPGAAAGSGSSSSGSNNNAVAAAVIQNNSGPLEKQKVLLELREYPEYYGYNGMALSIPVTLPDTSSSPQTSAAATSTAPLSQSTTSTAMATPVAAADDDPSAVLSFIVSTPNLLTVWKKINSHRTAVVFRRPVNPKEAPGYSTRILFPMDLSLIRKMIVSKTITTLEQLHKWIGLICHNCVKYNGRYELLLLLLLF